MTESKGDIFPEQVAEAFILVLQEWKRVLSRAYCSLTALISHFSE
jgi:hypothetical protein